MTSKRTVALDALIEQATVDAYGDEEQRLGLYMALCRAGTHRQAIGYRRWAGGR